MANSKVERRWVELDGVWRLMKINDEDPRYGDSVAYDKEAENGGMPSVSLAELRAGNSADSGSAEGGEVKTADRAPAAKKVAPAKKATSRRSATAGDDTGAPITSGDTGSGDATGDTSNSGQ